MGLYDGMDIVPASAAPAAPFPKSPTSAAVSSLYDGLEVIGPAQTSPPPREAKGFVESVQAGFQASAPGLAWRMKLPDLISNPEHASWWERAATGATQVISELPLMIGGAIAGAPVGGAIGTAIAPGPGTAAGTLLGAGFGMGAVPAAIRTSYMEALKAGGVKDAGDFWNALREVATAVVKEGSINAAAMGAGAVAGRVVGSALAPSIGTKIGVGTATGAIEATDLATQIALMPTIPAVLAGRLPAAHEFLDAAILIGGLKTAHVTAQNIASVYMKTGKTPAEQVADAQGNPKVAEDLAKPVREEVARPEVVIPRTEDGRVDMPKIQESLFAETARVDELELQARNAATPLSDAERVELEGLKARVASLEEQLAAGAQAATVPVDNAPRYAPEQLVTARQQAEARIAELDAKAAESALTDTERAQRVFLKNSLDKPEALAMHFKLEPAGGRVPTAVEREASAQRVYEDVLAQVRAADEARRGAGLEPLGEAHADAVARLVRARVRTRAARLGRLPEEIYNERPLQIRDEAASDALAPKLAEPATLPNEEPAPFSAEPEVDLFGEPIAPPVHERMAVADLVTQEIPLSNLVLSKEVPQFKNLADAQGVVVQLGGKFDRTGVGPIQVWERLNGTLEVISGRHRLDLARRSGEETIPAQVHREADGFDARQAATLDAQLNIREEQGSVADYAQYFKDAGISREAADERGLLARAKGRTGFAIARDASPDLLQAHRAGKLTDEAALAISSAAPGSDRLQALGMMQVQDGKSILFAVNTMRAVDLMAAERMAGGEQGDIFGFDDSAMKEASTMAKRASSKQRAIAEQIAAVNGASKRPELARKMGVNVEDPEGIQKKIAELRQEQYLWDNWPLYPELVAKLRELNQEGARGLGDFDIDLKPETPAEHQARDAEAAGAARRKLAREATTETPAFRTWFGESKVVDKDGAPAVVYHGTTDSFSAFDLDHPNRHDTGWLGNGVYATDMPSLANSYANLKRGGSENVMPLYAKLENPYYATQREKERIMLISHSQGAEAGRAASKAFTEELQAKGHDGVILAYTADQVGKANASREIVVFDPAGVKSAIGNRGTFNAQDQNILHQGRRSLDDTTPLPSGPFAGVSREQFLGNPKITKNSNAADLRPIEISGLADVPREPFLGKYEAKFSPDAGVVFDGNKVIASYNFGDTLVVDKAYRRLGVAEELVYQWRTRNPDAEPAGTRTKAAQAIQEKVWDRIQTEANDTLNQARALDQTQTEAFRRWSNDAPLITSSAADAHDFKTGEAIVVEAFHGTKRPDRVGEKFLKKRATSGPMAFHTSDPALASSYASSKQDTSLSYENQNYEAWFKFKPKGARSSVDIDRAWFHLTPEQRADIAEKLPHVTDQTLDGDTSDTLRLGVGDDDYGLAAKSHWEYEIKNARGNILQAAKEIWLNSGALFGREEVFLDILKMAGFPMKDLHYDPPTAEYPFVYKNYIQMQRPLVTNDVPVEVVDALTAAAKRDRSRAKPGGDMWDKGNRTLREWVNNFIDPANADRSYVWTSIPDKVTAVLKGLGYDGIVDWSGKGGGAAKPVYIPFEETQVKSAIGNKGTFNPDKNNILHQDPESPRGSYQIAANLITTLQGADKSTVVHELGHSWLEEMKADAARADAPPQIKADWDILRSELAIGADGMITRESHEQWARTVERYLAEGESPSVELRGVFERFKAWLLEIYESLGNLKANVTPELKGVLDRMLAEDAEIAAAREMDVPRAYLPEAVAATAETIVPPRAPKRKIEPGFKAEQLSVEPFADELPPGPGEAPDNTHVNYKYINTPTDVKLAMQRMAEIDQANIQAQRGGTEGVKSWAEANAEQARYLNDILGGGDDTLKLFEPRDPDAPHVDVRLGILKKLAVGAAKDSARLRDLVLEKGHDATVREQLEYLGSIERARMIQAEFLGERASVARALNALKDSTEGTGEIGKMLEAIGLGDDAVLNQAARTPAEEQAYLKAQLDQILLNYKGKTALDIAKLHKEIGTLKGTFKLAKEIEKASTWEQVIEAWRSGLLSGPVTHTTNLFGTGAFHVMRAPVDALAAVIGIARGASPGMGESDRASMSEAVARLTGMLGGVQDGLKVAYHTFNLDDPTGKTEAYRTAIPGRAGEIIRIPLRLMGAEDALVSTMYKRGELHTLAIRQAFDEGMNPSTREFAERVGKLLDNPTPEMEAIADAAATRMTFNMPLGEKGIALQGFVNKWNLQWMLPFIRTPINIFKELIRMSPFAPAIREWRADIAQGGVARDRALAEIAIGAGVMTATMAYAFAGNISGNGSPDPGKNRAKVGVWQPYSVLIGDTWYEYARIQPTGTLMGMAADMSLIWNQMTGEEKDKAPKLIAAAFANAITNQTFLQGITNVVNATSDPTRFGPRFLQQMAGSLVPNVIGQPTTMADPVVREVNGMLEAIQARIPGMRQDLLPKRDWLGEPVQTKERLGVVMPVREQKVSEDKVRLEADRLELSMAAAPKKTHIGKGTGKLGDVELTPGERDVFAKVGGEFAHKILTNIVNAPGYDEIPDLVKRRIFGQVLTASHKIAAVAAMPPEKRIAYLQSITEKVAAELTPGVEQ